MVTKKDCIGAIENYPPHVVELMLDEQERQGNPRNIAIFQEKADANYFEGGFTWGKSVKGPMFWSSIHNGHKFDIAMETTIRTVVDKAVQSTEVKEEPKQSEEIVVGSEVIADFSNVRTSNGTIGKKKIVISILKGDKGPIYVCVTEALLKRIMTSEGSSHSGLSIHSVVKPYNPKPEKVKLTLKDISEGKGVGIPPELIEIVN